jgi:hypothetical protein
VHLYKVGVSEGFGLTICLRDECVEPSEGTDSQLSTRGVGRVGVVSVCDLVD